MAQDNVSITVPYNPVAISLAAKMLTELAESFNKSTEEAPKKVLTETNALTNLNREPKPDSPSSEAKKVFAVPVVPAAPVKTPIAEHLDVDANGLPWDERIHAGTKTKDVKGNWKYLRGVDKVTFVPQVEAEIRARVEKSTPMAAVTPPAPAPETPAPPVAAVTPSISVTTFAQLVTAITEHKIPEGEVNTALAAVGVQSLALLGAKVDLIPTVAGHLGL